jgi:hypothetical protein
VGDDLTNIETGSSGAHSGYFLGVLRGPGGLIGYSGVTQSGEHLV